MPSRSTADLNASAPPTRTANRTLPRPLLRLLVAVHAGHCRERVTRPRQTHDDLAVRMAVQAARELGIRRSASAGRRGHCVARDRCWPARPAPAALPAGFPRPRQTSPPSSVRLPSLRIRLEPRPARRTGRARGQRREARKVSGVCMSSCGNSHDLVRDRVPRMASRNRMSTCLLFPKNRSISWLPGRGLVRLAHESLAIGAATRSGCEGVSAWLPFHRFAKRTTRGQSRTSTPLSSAASPLRVMESSWLTPFRGS